MAEEDRGTVVIDGIEEVGVVVGMVEAVTEDFITDRSKWHSKKN
jgi:hypothetical protein